MNEPILVSVTHPLVRSVTKAAYPEYRGRRIRLVVANHPLNVKSYWDGGSRDYFRFVRLADMDVLPVPVQSAFDKQIPGAEAVTLQPGIVCVEHSIMCGKDRGLRIHTHPDDLGLFA